MSTLSSPEIRRFDAATEFDTPERCFIAETSNTGSDAACSIAQARVTPGVTTAWHRLHGTEERYVVLAGRGLVEVGDLPPTEVAPGDVVLIPPLCRQRITNIGRDDLLFLAICTPRFKQSAYEDLESSGLA